MQIIPALITPARLKRELREHLTALGFKRSRSGELVPPDTSKTSYRAIHAEHWAERRDRWDAVVQRDWPLLRHHFASGDEIVPSQIRPRLEAICSDTWQSDLFRLASLAWSVPVSNGYGRRMRFLVWDDSNEKLLGLIALTDPVFNLSARDNAIGWSGADRKQRLINMMDAHVLGALPPYNQLLGGKLVACLVRTTDMRNLFREKYGSRTGIISGEAKNPQLFAVTTTSSLGRSSIYNRLKLAGTTYFRPIGFTSGYGHFHIPQALFERMRLYLDDIGHSYSAANRFGNGPNWRLRTIRACLASLGMSQELLRHHLQREVFVAALANNAADLLVGRHTRPNWRSLLSVAELTQLALDRWIVPRAQRRPEYRTWNRAVLREQILTRLIASTDYQKPETVSAGRL